MFERYTERARRTIFFSRYEASNYDSSIIETEHLLLGLLREEPQTAKLFGKDADLETARKTIEAGIARGAPSRGRRTDLPFSYECKQVLALAADEAGRLGHRFIGTEHLLLGLLRLRTCHACKVLNQHGVTLEEMRNQKLPPPVLPASPSTRAHSTFHAAGKGFKSREEALVTIHDAYWSAAYVRDAVSRCKEFRWHWHKRAWTPRGLAVNRKDGSISFDTTLAADTEHFQLVKDAWKKDYCEICRWELFESRDPEHGTAYTNGLLWICLECHEKFFVRGDFYLRSDDYDIT
jgi:hypothetical protein